MRTSDVQYVLVFQRTIEFTSLDYSVLCSRRDSLSAIRGLIHAYVLHLPIGKTVIYIISELLLLYTYDLRFIGFLYLVMLLDAAKLKVLHSNEVILYTVLESYIL